MCVGKMVRVHRSAAPDVAGVLLAGLDEFVHDHRPHGTLTGEDGARVDLFAAPPDPFPRARLRGRPLQVEGAIDALSMTYNPMMVRPRPITTISLSRLTTPGIRRTTSAATVRCSSSRTPPVNVTWPSLHVTVRLCASTCGCAMRAARASAARLRST